MNHHVMTYGMTAGAELDRRLDELLRKIAARTVTPDELVEYNRLNSRRVKMRHVDANDDDPRYYRSAG